MIVCPACGSATSVRESRDAPGYTRRRRICNVVTCGQRFTTFEVVVPDPVAVPDPIIVSRSALASVASVLEPAPQTQTIPEPVDDR